MNEEYVKWLENKIGVCLEDKDLQREHWAFCQALKKYRESPSQNPTTLTSGMVKFSKLIDQSKYQLIGYTAIYKDGSRRDFDDLDEFIANVEQPVVEIHQRGKKR